ncbi:vWA domain-containing protein [Acinetobacter courvalinii]|uniref:vWA domain-containing protein n=1 Tax=Acinetobacter courvalinii TaxID=280147 RepID=UPI00190245AA|nr:VWA domain-containing protein [Acinetobacter courvalinii]MBJ8419611.1 VWA domain-containing protein [Acinetobacter courvalinii]
MHQSTKILTLSLLSCMIMACSTPVKQYDQVAVETAMPVAPSPMTQSNQGLIKARKMIAPASYIAVMPTMERPRLEQNTEKYQNNEVNPVHRVADQAVSTFSIDVDTGSYTNTRRFLNDGRLPPVDAVRAEEMINYFDYQYPQPNSIHPFSVTTETVDSPWKQNAKLIKIGIQAKDLSTKQLPPANLVFLVDVSGSMDAADKLPLVKQTLRLLTEQLRAQDKVTIITYASGEKLVLEPTAGNQKDKILAVINALQASGATAGEQAIQLAYQQAEKAFVKNGINRILLATDGDFNVGITDFSTLKGMVAEKRKSGISLTTLGFGTGNYNEQLMEQLADAGDGNYSYIDNKNEAKKVVQRQLSSTLATVAQDVKIQVEFNPATVKEYRLVGYENRMLKQEDFNNDQVDAGDIGAGHNVTAIYEIIPVGQQGWLNDSRYQAAAKTDTTKKSEYAFVNLRYKLPNQEKSILLSQAVRAESRPLAQTNNDTRFAIAVASYAQQLKGGQYNGAMGWDQIIQLAQQSAKPDPYQMREEFVELAKIAKSLSAKKE